MCPSANGNEIEVRVDVPGVECKCERAFVRDRRGLNH
jgi:hypothetical protein